MKRILSALFAAASLGPAGFAQLPTPTTPRWTEVAPGEVVALEVRHYGESAGQLALYDDDGETFDYEKGDFSRTGLAVTRDANGRFHGTVTPAKNGRPWHYSDVKWTFMSAP